MRWSSAVAQEPQLEEAITNAAAEITSRMDGVEIDLAVVFVSHHFSTRYQDVLVLLSDALHHTHLVGCSAGGVIGGGQEVERRPGLSITAAHLPEVTITPICLTANHLPDADASPTAWSDATGIPLDPISHFILLADPFSFPAPQFLAGLDYAYPRSVKVGGLASGARQPGGNALYLDDAISHEGLVGVALRGNIAVDTIVAQGCRPVGETMRITRAAGSILLELEDKPALELIQELIYSLTEHDRNLARQALFVGVVMNNMTTEPRAGEFLIRNIVGIDAESGAIAVGEKLEDGQLIQFHVRDADSSAADLDLMLSRFAEGNLARNARGALLFSCLGRGMHLYGHQDHDTNRFQEYISDVPLGGFFCNGEIGPVAGTTHLHGFTSSFAIFAPSHQEKH